MSNPPLPPAPAAAPAPDHRIVEHIHRNAEQPVEPQGLPLGSLDLKVRESQTARHITITLLVMLGLTFVTNVVIMIVLTVKNRLDAAPLFDRLFSVWMPVLSGLVGSAVGFYLTKEKK
jgi:pilus assembly protein TadC